MPAVSRYACLIRESSRRLHPFVRIRGRRLSTSSPESRLPPSIWPCLQSHPNATYFCDFLITYAFILSQSPCHVFIALSQTNVVVTGLTALTLLYTRSAGVLYFITGALFTSGAAKVAKRFVRQPRPTQTLPGRQKQTYGLVNHFLLIAR